MSDFLRLFKILYKNQNAVRKYSSNTGKKKLGQSTILALCMLPLGVMLCVLLVFITLMVKDRQTVMVMLNVILTAVEGMMLFLMLSTILQTLYNSPDNAFLASLPMRPKSVFFAKFALVYVSALKLSAAFLLPCMMTIGITYAVSGTDMFHGFYPLVFLIVLVAPLLPLVIVTLFSMPLMWLSSFFKGKSSLKSFFAILVYILLFGGYFALITVVQKMDFGSEGAINSGILSGLSALADVMYPNKVLLSFCLGIDAGKNFGIFAAIWVGAGALAVFLSALFYRRITSKQTEAKADEGKKTVSYKQKNIVFTLMTKDFKSIIRNPSMAMNNFGNIVLVPILILGMYFIGNMKGVPGQSALASELVSIGFIMMYGFIFFGAANMLSQLAFTREGEAFFVSKTLPIASKHAVIAKLYLSQIPVLICLVILMILGLALFKINIVSIIMMAICIMLFSVGMSGINIYFDMKRGNVHWKTAADMRQASNGMSVGMLVTMILSLVPAMGIMVMGFTLGMLEGAIGEAGVLGILWAVAFVISFAIAASGLYILKNKGMPLYESLGEKVNLSVSKLSSPKKKFNIGGKNDGMLG